MTREYVFYCVVVPDSSDPSKVWVKDVHTLQLADTSIKKPGEKILEVSKKPHIGQSILLENMQWKDL